MDSEHQGNATSPIVIVGCQRSGTTMLLTMLGQHPMLLEHPTEPQFILELYQRFGYQIKDVPTAVTYLLKHPYFPKTIAPATLQQAYAGIESLSLQNFFQRYVQVWAGDKLLAQRPILKHPALIYHLDLVATLFPQVTIVHIVRDPRANVSSQKTRWVHYTTQESAMLWKNALQKVRHWKKSNPQISVFEVCYEKIVLDPETEINQLCQQLGIIFSPAMLSFEEETIEFRPGLPPKRIKFEAVDNSRVHQWQNRLEPIDIRLVESICQKEMIAWNYELLNPHIPTGTYVIRLWRERVHYFLKSNGRHIKDLIRKVKWRLGMDLLQIPPDKHY